MLPLYHQPVLFASFFWAVLQPLNRGETRSTQRGAAATNHPLQSIEQKVTKETKGPETEDSSFTWLPSVQNSVARTGTRENNILRECVAVIRTGFTEEYAVPAPSRSAQSRPEPAVWSRTFCFVRHRRRFETACSVHLRRFANTGSPHDASSAAIRPPGRVIPTSRENWTYFRPM